MLFVWTSCHFILFVISYSQEYHTDIPFTTYFIVIGLFISHNTHVKNLEFIAVVMWKQYVLSSRDTVILTHILTSLYRVYVCVLQCFHLGDCCCYGENCC